MTVYIKNTFPILKDNDKLSYHLDKNDVIIMFPFLLIAF